MNTLSTKTYRDKYRMATLDTILRRALISQSICEVDNGDAKTIQNPYGTQPSATIQTLSGNYSPADFTTTDDTLTVNYEVIVSDHVYDFENLLSNFNLFANRTEEETFAVAEKIDKFVLNELLDNAGESYSTPSGGFTADNVPIIMSNLIAKVAGYSDAYKGLFLVIESTDVPGFIQKQVASGFSFADAALKNGFMTSYMGVDIYVTRPGTFFDGTMDSVSALTFTNATHRLFGVKKVATYASPRSIHFEEKSVSGKTGKEIATWAYVGFKLWTLKANLIVDITLTA